MQPKKFRWKFSTKLPSGYTLGRGPLFEIPDSRVELLSKHFNLANQSVLEPGPLEGANTVSLFLAGAESVSIYDPHETNVELTKERCRCHEVKEPVHYQAASSQDLLKFTPLKFDLVFHAGLLYHLENPAIEIENLSALSDNLFLQTHFVSTGNEKIFHRDLAYFGEWKGDANGEDSVGGMAAKSFWMTISSIIRLLNINGKKNITILSVDNNSNSVCLLARSL